MRVLVVDDQPIIAQGIATILGYQPDIEVVGTAADGQEAVKLAHEHQPDIVLMDVRMPKLDGVAATAQLHRELPTIRILMLTTFDDDAYVVDALRAGASGYLLKDIPANELAQAIRAVYGGTYQLNPAIAQRLIAGLKGPSAPPPATPPSVVSAPDVDLTTRELEILRLLAQGATNKEIAAQLFLTEGTVKNHVSNILLRLGLRDRTHAAVYAHEHGLL